MTRKTKAAGKPRKSAATALRLMSPMPPRIPQNLVGQIQADFGREFAQWVQKHGHAPAYQAFCVDLHTPLDVSVGEFLTNSLTDGPNDKKVDLCHIDGARALIVQGYHAQNWGRAEAPANKAEDLHAAVSWLLSSDSGNMQEPILGKSRDLQNAIGDGTITRVDLCYVHNCHESVNVRETLHRVEEMAKSRIKAFHPPRDVGVHGHEIGLETVWNLLAERDTPILIGEEIRIPNIGTGIIRERNEKSGWQAIVLSVPADWVRKQFKHWGNRLFVANVRDFLGAPDAKRDINNEIKRTAAREPGNFWAFNNGITALTRKIMDDQGEEIVIEGISIVNGAQTTGALGGMLEGDLFDPASARVLLRVIEIGASSGEGSLIKSITRYNNTQNRLYPEDLRSKDPRQKALHEEFKKAGVLYAHRRGERHQPTKAVIKSNVAARLLCAFHGDPETALRSYRKIFDEEAQYKKVFPQGLGAAHLFLLDTLAEAFDEVKRGLGRRAADRSATQMHEKQLEFLAYSSAAKHFFFFIVGECSEEIFGRQIPDKHKWGVQKVGEEQKIPNPFYSVPRSRKFSEDVAKRMKEFVEGQRESNPAWLEKIRGLSALID